MEVDIYLLRKLNNNSNNILYTSIDFTNRKCATWDIRSCAITNHRAHKTNIYYRDGRAFMMMMMRVREYGATISASFNNKYEKQQQQKKTRKTH